MKKNVITKTLTLLGTIAVSFPLLAPVLLTVIFAIQTGLFRFDFLMPAELFPLVLAGGGLLLWAALRARARRAWIGWALSAAVALLFGGQGLAIVTGLASGERAPEGIWFILTVSAIAGYTLAVLVLAVGGIRLLGDLSKHTIEESLPST
jgi:hypothetical protein